ncbi:SRPBCC family protein [Kitasatospora sp. NPDC059571]|uniref:SRPBCC family protein n=1 Tax=Kitasatospora sp. NPDC059571 TaxID=3346871 RepID=UPI0036964B78
MPDSQRFIAAATVTVDAKAHDIWAVWVDVNGWKGWDAGIESSRLNGNFKEGNTFTLKPQGADPLEVTIKTVTQGEEFSDETVLPFGTIRNFHRMEQVDGRVKITHEVEATIEGDAVGFFGKEVWPHMQSGVAESLGNIADIVGND